MAKMKRKLILGTITALASYLTTRKLTQQPPKKGFEWISGEAEEGEEEPLPMFYEGDVVQLYNPYEGAFMTTGMFALEPGRYKVAASEYDLEEDIFRYKLDGVPEEFEGESGADVWYSEDWLSLPTTTTFTKVSRKVNPGREELTMKMEEIEQSILSKALDDSAKQTQIDYLLDRMNAAKENGKAEEVAEIERQLAEITSN